MTKQKNPSQIIRADGQGCFMEVMSDAFEIGKVHIGFFSYDTKREAGSRFTASVQVYLDIPEFLALISDVETGKLAHMAKLSKQEAEKSGSSYPKPIFVSMGGTAAERLTRPRDDKMGISRQFKITAGSKKPYLISAESGPGQADSKGLIVPRYNGRPEQRVMIPMDGTGLKRIMLTVKMHLQAYTTAFYMEHKPYIVSRDKGRAGQSTVTHEQGHASDDPVDLIG